MKRSIPGAARPLLIAGSGALILALGIWLASDRAGKEPKATASTPVAPAPSAASSTPQPVAGAGDFTLAAGATLEIDAADLPEAGSLAFDLQVPAPPAGVAGLATRVIAPDLRVREQASAPLAGAARDRVRFEVPADWLRAPGRYILEVKTTERTPLPLRRYLIEVR